MDNFILYDEISKGNNSIIYKGRRKGSINFVAIHCIEKSMRPEITNLVRLTYEISHKNVVKFYEWYETSNHLWLVVELCTGGTLDAILKQDTCLPESSIRQFGVDLCEGLYHIHSTGLLFCDLQPRKIMVDGNGTLKLGDFGLSKMEGENLEDIFQETFDSSYKSESAITLTHSTKTNRKQFGDKEYLAPEVLGGEDNTKSSDLWSLGCILYEMYTGHKPYVGDSIEQLLEKITTKEFPIPKGNKLSTKPSTEFLNLLKALLEKDVAKRINWKQTLKHPFWEGKLLHLVPTTKSIIVDGKETFIEEPLDEIDRHRLSTDRPKTALDQKPEMNVSFSMSSRLPQSPQNTMHTRNAVQYQESEESSNRQSQQANRNEYRKLFFLQSELNTSQIIDNNRIQKPAPLKFEPKSIPIINNKMLKAETFLQLPKDEFTRLMDSIKTNTNVPADKSAIAIKVKLQLMNYIGSICNESTRMADEFINIELYRELINIIRSGHNLEMKMKAARILAIMFSKASKLDVSKEFTDTLQSLIDIISANRKDIKLKQALLPTLGELLYAISNQETLIGKSVETWSVPSLSYLMLIRSIGEDLTVNHIVCKIIEKIASTNSAHVQKFMSMQTDVVNALWSCYAHAANCEQLRVTSLNALCILTSHSVSIFQSLIDKVGLDVVLDCLTSNNTRIQQSMLTIISMYVNESGMKNIPEKKLISKLTPIYDCTNVNCRSKAYLLTYIMLKQQNEFLLQFTQSKLINCIERDFRKNFNNKDENDYIHKTLGHLVSMISTICILMMDELISTLEPIIGRKNPSTQQSKQLKRTIPTGVVIKLLFANQTFRSRILDENFIVKYGKLVGFAKYVTSTEFNLDVICGNGMTTEFTNVIINILDTIAQTKEVLRAFSEQIVHNIIPPLVKNVDLMNADLSVESLRVLSEISCILLNKQEAILNSDLKGQFKTHIEGNFIEIIDKLMVQPEPLPFFALTIVGAFSNCDVSFLSILKTKNVLQCIIKLLVSYKTKIGSALTLKILNILNLWSSGVDASDLYDNGIVECLKLTIVEIQKIKKYEDKSISEALIEVLRILDNLFKYVSEFVKKALQAKKLAGSTDTLAQQAEKLLQCNKPFINICPHLIHLLLNEDNDVSELSCKVLWVIMQLFGGECKDLVTQDNMNTFMTAIITSNSKRQKILLRIVKRIITADKSNLELFKSTGQNLIDCLRNLKTTASAEANVGLASLIDEVLKVIV